MVFLNIVKDGIENVVDERMYENVYKPAGWKIVGELTESMETTSDPADEIKKKNIDKMKRTKEKKFDDGLVKGEKNGKI